MDCSLNEKRIKGFPDYIVCSNGSIISEKRGSRKVLTGGRTGEDGYNSVSLRHNGRQEQKLIHRLVAENFIPIEDGKFQVNHIDGNKLNNDVSNLEWVSPKENMVHAVENGLWTPPSKDHYNKMRETARTKNAMFTLEEASDIIEMKEFLGLSCRELSKIIGCDKGVIQRLVNGKTTHFKNGVV